MISLELQLKAKKQEISIGEPFCMSINLKNTGDEPTYVVGILDGSEHGIRFPKYIPRITGPVMESETDFICGTVLPIKEKYFRILQPKESFDPTERVDANEFHDVYAFKKVPTLKGEYTFNLTYSTESSSTRYWLGQGIQNDLLRIEELINKVPKLSVTSHYVNVTVV